MNEMEIYSIKLSSGEEIISYGEMCEQYMKLSSPRLEI